MFSKNANMQNKAKQSETTQTQNRNQRTVSSCLLTFIFSFAQNTNSRRCLRAGSSRLQLRLSSRGVYQCALPHGGSWVHFPLPLFIPYFFTLFCGDFPTLSFQHPRSANTVVSAVTVLPAHREMIFTETAAAAQSVPDVRLFSLCSLSPVAPWPLSPRSPEAAVATLGGGIGGLRPIFPQPAVSSAPEAPVGVSTPFLAPPTRLFGVTNLLVTSQPWTKPPRGPALPSDARA